MSTLDIRNTSAMMKRAEQLKRWEESDTNTESPAPREEHGRKIRFSSGCVFLAACLSGDKDEVLHLVAQGADINTANIDGLTALHQACIDDNLDMVEFLVENGADINRQDNEGWTPLHATASCGFVSIARYLVENGADVAAVNSDGDLALDLAIDTQHMEMIQYMESIVRELQIDVEKARKSEEEAMLSDAKKWLRSDASEVDRPLPKTGATALHVAAAKGYIKVISLLLAGRANVDKQDNDGWTPLHAAAHWCQKEAAEMLIEAMADMDIRNYAGQTCIDVADRKLTKHLEELRTSKRNKRRPTSQISRISDTADTHAEKSTAKLLRVEMRNDVARDEVPENESHNITNVNIADANDVILRRTQSFEHDQKFYQKYKELRERIKANSCPILPAPAIQNQSAQATLSQTQSQSQMNINNNNNNSNNNSNSNSNCNTAIGSSSNVSQKNNNQRNVLLNSGLISGTRASSTIAATVSSACAFLAPAAVVPPTTLTKITAPLATATATSTVTQNTNTSSNITNCSVQRSGSLKDSSMYFRKPAAPSVATTASSSANLLTTSTTTTPTVTLTTPPIRRSFVPPVRDEESETQRKAHAKRVRETRRSTQGVTLDEIKSAEELVKKKNMGITNTNSNNNNNNNNYSGNNSSSGSNETQYTTATSLSSTSTSTSTSTSSTASSSAVKDASPETNLMCSDQDESSSRRQSAVSPSCETTATFTISSPFKRKRTTAHDLADRLSEADPEDNYVGGALVSASYTIRSRSESNNDRTEVSANKSNLTETTTTDVLYDNSKAETHLSPNTSETSLLHPSVSASKTSLSAELSSTSSGSGSATSVVLNPAYTEPPAVVTITVDDSPVRLRNKRTIAVGATDQDTLSAAEGTQCHASTSTTSLNESSETVTSPTQTEFNPRDSLLSCYGRRAQESASSSSNTQGSPVERRPSWRLKFDAGSKFKLEDASAGITFPPNNGTIIASAPAVIAAANLGSSGLQRRVSANLNTTNSSSQTGRSGLSSTTTSTSITTITGANSNNNNDTIGVSTAASSDRTQQSPLKYDSSLKPSAGAPATTEDAQQPSTADGKDNDKENDNRTPQGVIQRRRKHKRRSTGIVHIDMEELELERHESSTNETEDKDKSSGSEATRSRSRLGSATSNASATLGVDSAKTSNTKTENGDGEIDYKALWEAAKLENDKLKQLLKQKDDEVAQTRSTIERLANATAKNSLSELEKRERRAMERKLSELEEELKQLETYKTENHRLKEENGALIRVISKLSK